LGCGSWSKEIFIVPDLMPNLISLIVATDYIIQVTYTPNLLIGTNYPCPIPWISIEMIAEWHMPLGPDWRLVLQTSSATLGPYARMPLLSIASHILKAIVPWPIDSFVLGLRSSERAELQVSQLVQGQI